MNPQYLLPANWLDLSPLALAKICPLQAVDWTPFRQRGLHLSIKREDLLGFQLGGNKVYKLYGHLRRAQELQAQSIASFGGAWSNHLLALAQACADLGLKSLGIVRGDQAVTKSAMLLEAEALGMRLHFIDRQRYREKNAALQAEIDSQFGLQYWVPEGGGGIEGARHLYALREAVLAENTAVDTLAHACGTGTSLAGLTSGAKTDTRFLGVAVLKGASFLNREVESMLAKLPLSHARWEIYQQGHCGGYAKLPAYLTAFIDEFESECGIQLDPVYTAKLMYALKQLAEAGYWRAGAHIVAIHSGGLQGRRGWACFQGADCG